MMRFSRKPWSGCDREPCSHDRLASVIRVVGVVFVLLVLPSVCAAQANSPTPLAWSPNRVVRAMAEQDGRLYLGGDFTRIAPLTGSAAVLDKVAGNVQVNPGFPRISGFVNVIVSDGQGGWYAGGFFDSVAGVPTRNLIHVLADGTVDPLWTPAANGEVFALVVSGNRVFVAGQFTKIKKKKRSNLAALDARTGKVLSWTCNTDTRVTALALKGSRLFVGGWFTMIQGVRRNGLAVVSAGSGTLEGWNPDPELHARIDALAIGERNVFFGGSFIAVGGQQRNCIAAADLDAGSVSSWDARARGVYPDMHAIAVRNGVVYIGGDFSRIGDETRLNVAALDERTSAVLPWSAVYNTPVEALAVDSGFVYVGGHGTGNESTAVAFDATTGAAATWNAHSNGFYIRSIAITDTSVAIAGAFSMAGGVERGGLAALDALTGEPLDWNPRLERAFSSSPLVTAIATRGSRVYIGGQFDRINGEVRVNLAEVDATTGAVTPLRIDIDGEVRTLALDGSTLYIGGVFSRVYPANVRRNGLAAIDVDSGVLTDFAPAGADENHVEVYEFAFDETTIYVGGKFTAMDLLPRNAIAAIDKRTGRVTAWNPNVTGFATCGLLVVDGPRIYVSGAFPTIGGLADQHFVALERSTAAVMDWTPPISEGPSDLVVHGNTLLLAGSFRDVFGPNTYGRMCAVDMTNNTVLPWGPQPDDSVSDMFVRGNRLYVCGRFTQFDYVTSLANYVAVFALDPSRE